MSDVCPNIGPAQRQRRLRLGFLGVGTAIVAAAILRASDAGTLIRASVFAPLVLGMFGFFQYRARTCVRLAARGRRNLDSGTETIADDAERAAVAAQARVVTAQAIGSALLITALYLALG